MPDPLTEAEDFPYGKTDASGQPAPLGDEALPETPSSDEEEEAAKLGDFA